MVTEDTYDPPGPVAVVTGGSEGFGKEVARSLVAAGWTVRIDGRRPDLLAKAAAEIDAVAVPGDVTDPVHRRRLIPGDRLDLLVNNASSLGPTPRPQLAELTEEDLRRLFETNVLAPLALIQLALPVLFRTGGAILNVTSDAAVCAYEGWGGYGASKAALEQISAVLAHEVPAVRVWWLDPGDMRTAMHQAAFPGEDISDRADPAAVAPVVTHLLQTRPPSGRIAAAELLADQR